MITEVLGKMIPKMWYDILILLGLFLLVVAITVNPLLITLTNNNALFLFGFSLVFWGIFFKMDYSQKMAWMNMDNSTGTTEVKRPPRDYLILIIAISILFLGFGFQFQIIK